ncbi:hypothetical protein ACFQ51_37370 [Streptomyces kaempferi]
MTASQRRPISRRTRVCVLLALLATTSATLSACGGDRASDKSTTLTSVVGDQAKAKYVACGTPPVKLEKIDQDFLDGLAAAAGRRCTRCRTTPPAKY